VSALSSVVVRLVPLLPLLFSACGEAPVVEVAGDGPPADAGRGANAGDAQDPAPRSPQPGAPGFEVYDEQIGDSGVSFAMVPIPGGTFVMGSAPTENGSEEHERPAIEVAVAPFWMGRCEVTWAEYDLWNTDESLEMNKKPDGFAKPTPPYMDMTFNMGRDGYPAICMSHVAARRYCAWLSRKTGHFYRLATEAEWEYACRAGSATAYSFGDDPAQLGEHAWFAGNSAREIEAGVPPERAYHQVGTRAANAFGLHDMHGNVAEWVADFYLADAYAEAHGEAPRDNPYFPPETDRRGRPKRFAHVARGGSWRDEAPALRSAARLASEPMWNQRDPQVPKSYWYLTDGQHIGFRVVRPFTAPTDEARARFEKP